MPVFYGEPPISTLPHVLIVSPALASVNNGNWQTASRWARALRPWFQTSIVKQWQGERADALLALHARWSADSIAAWAQEHGSERLTVVLTGTDLYRDIHSEARAQQSLALAGQLVVLQDQALKALPPACRPKAQVIYQSTARRATLEKTSRHLRAVMAGHLRDEKDPLTYLRAAAALAERPDIFLDHVGNVLDLALGQAAVDATARVPNYRWLGGLTHAQTRARIQRAHVLVHPSKMEGGAHVIMEAVQSGTPVLASRVDGNVGMLGERYAGYFAQGDDAALVALLVRCREDAQFLPLLARQCAARAALFEPAREQQLLRKLVASMLGRQQR